MTDPSFNLAQLPAHPNWYDFISQAEAAMAEDFRIHRIRRAAGWTTDEGDWISPDGIHEDDWAEEDYPFPEDESYAAFASAYFHYEAVDADELERLDATLRSTHLAQEL